MREGAGRGRRPPAPQSPGNRVTAVMRLVISVLRDHPLELGGGGGSFAVPQRLTAIERFCPGMVM
jgi:hypothetical protein